MNENEKLQTLLQILEDEIEDALKEHAIADSYHEYDHASGRISLAKRLIEIIKNLLNE